VDVAVIAIDLHRGHLDPKVATLPLEPEAARTVVTRSAAFFEGCRERGIPIIHLVTRYRDQAEILANPAWLRRSQDPQSTRKNMANHNIEGMPGIEIMPELWRPGDVRVDTKKRYDCFIGTDLDFVLQGRGIREVWMTGVNTNSCVLATSIQASVRDYDVAVVSDCVDSMDGEEFHHNALQILGRAFTEVHTGQELLAAFDERRETVKS
jgi:nicotinamidase-related amidase